MCKHCGTSSEKTGFCVVCKDEICVDCANDSNNTVHIECLRPPIIAIETHKLVGRPKPHNRKGVRGVPRAMDRIGGPH